MKPAVAASSLQGTIRTWWTHCKLQGDVLQKADCADRRILTGTSLFDIDHQPQTELLRRLRSLDGVGKVFVASGIRHALVWSDASHKTAYLEELVSHHVSGQLKLAPEHCVPTVLEKMGKPGTDSLLEFRDHFSRISRQAGRRQFLTYYFLAAHPGCTESDMRRLRAYIDRHLKLTPEQVQIFTPTSRSRSCTEGNPFTGEDLLEWDRPKQRKDILRKRGETE
jgi:radical SAM superfamily enzyme YgiQ (UPF0313 family)